MMGAREREVHNMLMNSHTKIGARDFDTSPLGQQAMGEARELVLDFVKGTVTDPGHETAGQSFMAEEIPDHLWQTALVIEVSDSAGLDIGSFTVGQGARIEDTIRMALTALHIQVPEGPIPVEHQGEGVYTVRVGHGRVLRFHGTAIPRQSGGQ